MDAGGDIHVRKAKEFNNRILEPLLEIPLTQVNSMCKQMHTWESITQIRMGRMIYGALVQFGCYQHRCEWKGLWCSSTVQLLLSTQT